MTNLDVVLNPSPEPALAPRAASTSADSLAVAALTNSQAEPSTDSEGVKSNHRALVTSLVIAGFLFGVGFLILVISLL